MQTMDPEVVVATRYDTAGTVANFLSVFLGKCGVENNEEIDHRPCFPEIGGMYDNFILLYPIPTPAPRPACHDSSAWFEPSV